MTDTPEFILDRVFDAPRNLVWKAWTDPDLLSHWYGPGVETIIHHYDLRPGGQWRNEMKFGPKSDLSRMDFQEVVPEEKLVWLHHSTDAEWNTVANPMMPDWPRVLLTTVTFEAQGSKTNVRLTLVPVDATKGELECFAQAMAGLSNGWGAGYKLMDAMFAEMQAK